MVSIHDVEPRTLDAVGQTIESLDLEPRKTPLLVVPGAGWSQSHIKRLMHWQNMGFPLAGHGWLHLAAQRKGLYHRIHSLLMSANAAEHLSLDSDGIFALIRKCAEWFPSKGLKKPDLYVPPAWAMGRMAPERLSQLPFRYYETLSGIYDSQKGTFRRLPLTGYETLRPHNIPALKILNFCNRTWSKVSDRPLRISIHPSDIASRLGNDLRADIETAGEFITCADIPSRESF
jgi:hypothetical protein